MRNWHVNGGTGRINKLLRHKVLVLLLILLVHNPKKIVFFLNNSIKNNIVIGAAVVVEHGATVAKGRVEIERGSFCDKAVRFCGLKMEIYSNNKKSKPARDRLLRARATAEPAEHLQSHCSAWAWSELNKRMWFAEDMGYG